MSNIFNAEKMHEELDNCIETLNELAKEKNLNNKEILKAINFIKNLADQNESLWMMIEEMKASDIKNFEEDLQKAHATLMLETMRFDKKSMN